MRRLSFYIHQFPNWPRFTWDATRLASALSTARHAQGRLLGRMEGLGFELQQDALLKTLTLDVTKSSEIEGQQLNLAQVRSSVARRLGIDIAGAVPADRHVEGVVEMMLDAAQNFAKPLTAARLKRWQAALFPTGLSGMQRITVGAWRDDKSDPMQVVSGALGRQRVHFEAPPAKRIQAEMTRFIKWANQPAADPIVHAALAHLWFLTIHPFEDGNGRVARAIADWYMARAERSSYRFYSMSAQIMKVRADYYKILESTQRGTLDITEWLLWFVNCLTRAIHQSDSTLSAVLAKARLWKTVERAGLNARQSLMLNKLMDGFVGKLTSSKWAKITKCSQDTAQRDIQELIEQGILERESAGGRSTSYALKERATFEIA